MTKRITTQRRSGSSGQTLALFALVIPAMLGLMGLGLDTAQVLLERRHAQGASDLAALAGARSLPGSQSAATAEAIAVAQANGYPAGDVTVTFPSAIRIKVQIAIDVGTFFLPALGIDDLSVSAAAVSQNVPADFPGGANIPAIIGGWQSCGQDGSSDKVVQMAGADITVTGKIHSNGGTFWNGDNGSVSEGFEFVKTPPKPPKTHLCQDNIAQLSGNPPMNPQPANVYMPYPEPYGSMTPAQLCTPEPGKTVFDLGTSSINIGKVSEGYLVPGTDQLKDGVYCLLTPGATLSIATADIWGNVTLVADQVKLSRARIKLAPYYEGLTVYAYGTDSNTLQWNGADGEWLGLMFAPNGPIHVAGAKTNSDLGAMWGYTVQFNGEGVTLSSAGLTNWVSTTDTLTLVE